MAAYYNEIDPFAAQWLRNLIEAGHIAPGVVDERSIEDVRPDELAEFTQCHFFAGVGIWSLALRNAGWDDSRRVWTGSCPCQPFSTAGKSAGFADERHLWPSWFHLISECRPDVIFGEQVASKDGLAWLDLVQTDLEGTGYAGGPVDTCAAGFGAPHIRQRLYFAAYDTRLTAGGLADADQCGQVQQQRDDAEEIDCTTEKRHTRLASLSGGDRTANRMEYANSARTASGLSEPQERQERDTEVDDDGSNRQFRSGAGRSDFSRMEHTHDAGESGQLGLHPENRSGGGTGDYGSRCNDATRLERAGPTNGYWRDADWLFCRDGKWRSVEPGTFPLVDGATGRVGRLRAYGNAIVAPQAQAVVEVMMEYLP